MLDDGMRMFAGAVHAVEPPPELRGRVLGALAEEWRETVPDVPGRRWLSTRWLSAAALLVALVGALSWGAIAHVTASRYREDALSYREFLAVLGGRDVRVGEIEPKANGSVEGAAVLYDSSEGQSWALVLLQSPGRTGPLTVSIRSSSTGRSIPFPFPVKIDRDGEGSGWLVTSAEIARYGTVMIRNGSGRIVASGIIEEGLPE